MAIISYDCLHYGITCPCIRLLTCINHASVDILIRVARSLGVFDVNCSMLGDDAGVWLPAASLTFAAGLLPECIGLLPAITT